MSKEVEAIEDGGEGLARGGEFVTQRADTHAGGIGHLALVAVFAVGEEQDGLMLSVRCESARSKSMTRTMRALLSRVRRSRHPSRR